MKIRLMKMLLFVPCLIIDGLQLVFIALPYWVLTGEEGKFNSKLVELFND